MSCLAAVASCQNSRWRLARTQFVHYFSLSISCLVFRLPFEVRFAGIVGKSCWKELLERAIGKSLLWAVIEGSFEVCVSVSAIITEILRCKFLARKSAKLFANTKGSSVIFELFLNPYSRRICLDSPPPPDFRTKKKCDGHPNVYVYQYWLEHPYKLYAGPLVDSTPLHHNHHPDNSSLRSVYRTLSPRTPAMLFVTDDQQRRVFCRERRPWQSCTVGGGRTSHAFTSISVSKCLFRWRLAWRVTDVCETTQHECENFPNWWLKTIIVLRIAACEGEHPDGSSVASKGSKGHPSAPVQLRLRPSTFAVATDTTTGEPFNCFLA